jgi:hypothetical protein
MSSDDNQPGIKITLDDLESVQVPESRPEALQPAAPGSRSYGSITDASGVAPATSEERGSFLMQGWFYLGAAGLLGALAGWGICEPGFVEEQGFHWGNLLLMPVLVTLMSIGFGIAESIAEHSAKKALIRGLLSLPLGLVLGFIFDKMADILYMIALTICSELGAHDYHNPSCWLARGLAWMVFGVAGGVIYGIVGLSFKKGLYGSIGGLIGAGLGGVIFDPISFATHGGAPSRAIGLALVGLATGVGMGIVESAMKDRWLYVTSGPLAGKQFILYKPQTMVGSEQASDIYLFKDPSILPQHAVLVLQGGRMMLRAMGSAYVSGSPVQNRMLQDGDLLQIGRYAFRYKEKQRS